MILHLFKKDLRRSRILLIVWLLLVMLECALIGMSVSPGDRVLQGIYYTISGLVPLFQMLVLAVVIPHLVQEEPLVGTTGFWLTRPILRSSLLQAKALFVAMLIALPLLAEVGVLAANGITSRDIALAVPEIVLSQVSFIMVIAVLAALTSGFGRFAIAGAVVMVAWTVAQWGIFWLQLFRHPGGLIGLAQNLSLLKSRGVARDVLFAIGGGAIVIHQYLTRKTAWSVAGAAAVGAGAIAIAVFWPWNFLAPSPLPEAGKKFDLAAVRVSLGQTSWHDLIAIRGVGVPQKNFDGSVVTTGFPIGYVATPKRVHPRLSLPDGRLLKIGDPEPAFSTFPDLDEANLRAIESALDAIPVVNPGASLPLQMRATGLFKMDTSDFGRYGSQPLNLSADVDFVVSHYVVRASMPLVRGSRYDRGSEHAVITDVLRQGDGVDVVLRWRDAQLLFDRSGKTENFETIMNQDTGAGYLLRNKKRNEAVLQKQNFDLDIGALFSQFGAKRLVQHTLRLSFGPDRENLTPDLTDAWLADAELVLVERVPVAEFSRQLVAGELRLDHPDNRAVGRPAPTAADLASLAHLALPKNATKAQAKDYIDSILAVSQGRVSYQQDDPPVEMLAKVGSENVDVLLDAEERMAAGMRVADYLDWTILRLARPEDKELILRALPDHPKLIDVVIKYDWKVEAHDTLMAEVRDERLRNLPGAWIEAVASFEEPSSYADLRAYLVRCVNKQRTFNAIRKLPGIDLKDTVDVIWRAARYGNPRQIIDTCGIAAEFGHLDGIEAAVNLIRQDRGSESQQKRAAFLIRKFTAAAGDNAALVAWFDANRGRLVFDPKLRKFAVSPQPATAKGLFGGGGRLSP